MLRALVTVMTVVLIGGGAWRVMQTHHACKLGGQQGSFLHVHQFFLSRCSSLLSSFHSFPLHPSVLKPHFHLHRLKTQQINSSFSLSTAYTVQHFKSNTLLVHKVDNDKCTQYLQVLCLLATLTCQNCLQRNSMPLGACLSRRVWYFWEGTVVAYKPHL